MSLTDPLSKIAARAEARRRRRAARLRAPRAGEVMARRFLAGVPVPPGATVAAYWPGPFEADPRPLMAALARRGHALALPCIPVPGGVLVFRRWADGDGLVPGPHGTRVPPPAHPAVVPDVIVVPLLGFDRHGRRLGQGGGYYDRTLARLRRMRRLVAVGLAYAAQEFNSCPADPHDQPLDWIVTEAALIRTRR